MTNFEIYSHIDHTLLKPFATWEEIKKLCNEAITYHTASVCVPQSYVAKIKEKYGHRVNICTVVGFPLGYNSTLSKIQETEQALAAGANEIDMVINLTDVKNGDFELVEAEIALIKKACGHHILKVIVEACYLTEEEKIKLCEVVTHAGADFIKTSTGFGPGGATFEDVSLFSKHIGKNVGIKAAGGVKSKEDLVHFIALGCERIGTSSAIQILKDESQAD